MPKIDYEAFEKWALEDSNRHVKIDISKSFGKEKNPIGVWVYDYKLESGQYVTSVDQIDLHAVRRSELERRIKELENAGQ